MNKKILIIGVCDTDRSSNIFMKKGFEKLGYHVDEYNYRTVAQKLGSRQAMWKDFTNYITGKTWDLLIFSKVNSMHPDLLHYAKNSGKVVYWFMDGIAVAKAIDVYQYAKNADIVSVTSEEVKTRLQNYFKINKFELNIHQIIEGFDPDFHYRENLPEIYDVIFAGSATPQRIKDIARLKEIVPSLQVWGNGWPKEFNAHPQLFKDDIRKVICQSKIVLNLVHSNIFSDRIVISMACGAFVLSQYCHDLENFFKMGEHLDWFKSWKGAKEKINFYLENVIDRDIIAKFGNMYVRENFNWTEICYQLLRKSL